MFSNRKVESVTNGEGALTAEFLLPGDLQEIGLYSNRAMNHINSRTGDPYTLAEAFDLIIASRQAEVDNPNGFQPQKAENKKLIEMLKKEKEKQAKV